MADCRGRAAELFTDADGWVSMQIFGMGIASQDLTGDGYPEVYLTSQGDNKLQTLLSGAEQPTYRDIALRRGVNAPQPFTGGDSLPVHRLASGVRGRQQRRLRRPLRDARATSSEQAGYATRDPSDLLLGQTGRHVPEGADAAGIVELRARSRRQPGRPQPRRDARPRRVNLGAPVDVWRNVGRGTATHPAAMGNWIALRLEQPGPNRDAIGAWIEVRIGETTLQRELTVGGGHACGALGWIHFGLGEATGAEVRVTWPDGEAGAWQTVEANGFARSSAAARSLPGSPGLRRPDDDGHGRGWREVALPDFGMPDAMPEIPPGDYAARLERLRERG